MPYTEADVESLAEKIASLDLTDGELEALEALVRTATAGEDEVSGYWLVEEGVKTLFLESFQRRGLSGSGGGAGERRDGPGGARPAGGGR